MALPLRKGMDAIKSMAGGGKTFSIKNPGDKAILWMAQPIDEVVIFDEHGLGEGKNKRYYLCTGDDCPLCEAGIKTRSRAMPMVITPQGKLDFFKMSRKTFKKMVAFQEKYKTLMDRPYEFTRNSENMDPYNVIPEDKQDMPAAYKELLSKPLNPEDVLVVRSRQEMIVALNNHLANPGSSEENSEGGDPTKNF